jgi:hypothetical protein
MTTWYDSALIPMSAVPAVCMKLHKEGWEIVSVSWSGLLAQVGKVVNVKAQAEPAMIVVARQATDDDDKPMRIQL